MGWPKGVSTDHLRSWTEEQEQYVRDNYNGKGSDLAKVLPFSASSIRNKAKRLGVKNKGHFHNVVKTEMPKLSESDMQYLAGFFDGEGSFYRHQKGWRVSIGNSDKDVILWIAEAFKGYGKFDVFPPRKQQHLPSYTWRLNRQGDVWSFMEIMEPYLKIKNKIALFAIKEYEAKFKKT
jgi:hypothetical protein